MAELYQTQRAMRNIRRAALQRGVIGILDIGTSKIACLVLRFDGTGTFRETDGVGPMAGQVNFRVIGAASTRTRTWPGPGSGRLTFSRLSRSVPSAVTVDLSSRLSRSMFDPFRCGPILSQAGPVCNRIAARGAEGRLPDIPAWQGRHLRLGQRQSHGPGASPGGYSGRRSAGQRIQDASVAPISS